ncbi:chemotaxis protein CheA [Parachitinimonas caeni]|uniref:Chemotaxis protein CheA n=1 Tax=Parachitinimonas caeni TaxID=3031301 RepID=A0ABT7DVF5_9NEIS|nr:chemotaxis protein CheA [Parachitinimonas caeni]MDK2124053.1 chemotaxis protein CheA [Parachitinimonas caeni]
MNLEKAKQTFIDEANELLLAFEDDLLRIESAPDPERPEIINSLFRAAHTIKGSAGLFGFDYIVSFTHVLESVLDKVREGGLTLDAELISLLLNCRDYVGNLIDALESGIEIDPARDADRELLLVRLQVQLKQGIGDPATVAGTPVVATTVVSVASPEPQEATATREADTVASDHWHLSLRFGPDVLRNGMDPLSFIRYLGTLGRIVYLTTLYDGLPPASQMDPESCYLGFEIEFDSAVDKQTIENVFEFVRDDSTVRIIPPHSKLAEYISLIGSLPEDQRRLGEILLQGGALTYFELEEVLRIQRAEQQVDKHAARPLGAILVEENVVPPQAVLAALEKQKQSDERKSNEHRFIKVEAAKLDSLINLVGELVIAGAAANLLATRSHSPELIEATTSIAELVERIRDGALTMRMVHIAETFNRFPRVVRDVSRELGKQIELSIGGGETELDKSMVEKLGDPLMHIVRNAIDHGIEPEAERLKMGKPVEGKLSLTAFHESGSIVIEVSDDGGGINRARVLAKALQKGLVPPDLVLSDREILNLIFEPGFSTAEQVTNLSGRGVGMDVVKRSIEQLRGEIELESEEGLGTLVRIRLPLTLAIIDGFQVVIGRSTFVIPLDLVIECLDLQTDSELLQPRYLNLRGEVLPYVRLRDLFDIEAPPPARENVVVVQYGNARAGLVVDQLLGEFQAVIKPLGQLFRGIKGIGGSTILGTGEVALILDVPQLIQLASAGERAELTRHLPRHLSVARS